ncbi:MAG: hypothetical protein AAGG69_10010 [Pseudomonadota bacterium]
MRKIRMTLIILSHIVNIVVVTIIPFLIFTNAPSMVEAYGPDTPARRILACLYATIALTSAATLVMLAMGRVQAVLWVSAALFAIQTVYKVGTWPTVGLGHPVVNANLMISVLHAASLAFVFIRLSRPI